MSDTLAITGAIYLRLYEYRDQPFQTSGHSKGQIFHENSNPLSGNYYEANL